MVDAGRSFDELTRIAGRIRKHRASAVLDLEGLDAEEQMLCSAAFLNGLFDADRDSWFPMLIAVDEAPVVRPGRRRRGFRRGAQGLPRRDDQSDVPWPQARPPGIIATQRLAKLAKNVAAEASNFLMGRTFLDIDMARASDLLGWSGGRPNSSAI